MHKWCVIIPGAYYVQQPLRETQNDGCQIEICFLEDKNVQWHLDNIVYGANFLPLSC